ncbi:MAG TPA: peptidylprolyl isomerase [Eggerthellaceae bacterium]|nr:peptidylprolyl isomerase [Eggerthellaceae bacterium]
MIQDGQKVKVDFIGKLANGAEFSNSYLVGEPFEFIMGQGVMLAAFEDVVRTMSVGDTVSTRIPCEKAYGAYDESLVERVPMAMFPNSQNLEVGKFIVIETPEESIRAKLIKAEEGWLYFDRNHELAGEDLLFEITLADVEDAGD